MRVLLKALLVGFALMAIHAAVLVAPISGQFPDTFGACTGCTQLAYISSTVASINGTFTATLNTAVYSDPGNTFCAGCLDFVYQVVNSSSSPDNLGRVTVNSFKGWEVDAGYSTAGEPAAGGTAFPTGTIAPGLVDRNTDDTVGFQFTSSPSTAIAPGSTSTVLVVETNATSYTTGNMSVLDGGVATVAAFEPTTATVTPPDFTISVAPPSRTITTGRTNQTTYTITLAAVGGLTGSVALSCSGNPPGTCAISPSMVTLNGTATATITLASPTQTTPGTYILTFTGEIGSITHTAKATLTVN